MFRFESPSAFYYLWLLPVVVFMSWFLLRQNQKKIRKAFGDRLTPFLTSSLSVQKRRWKQILQVATILFFVLALARPQMGESKQEVRSEGVELMLLVDVSDSMMAEDARPNRLEQVKVEMSKLMDLMPGNKMGIIAFAGSSTLLSPLSTDPSALKMYLDSLSPLSVSTQGTEFRKALIDARDAFHRGGVTKDETVKVTRVILIASDGEDNEPGALEQAKKLTEEGIRIFTLAYGTEKGAPIPERDNMGFLRGYKKDRKGQTILTTVNGEALEALAKSGMGSFYHASFGGTHLQRITEDIGKLEKTEFESEMATSFDEKFQFFLALALMLSLIEILLGERRSVFRLWRGRFEVPPG
jgi:Ca-activated chloride channel family protein